ncbi:conserved hypothetical protein [Ricinus communis]|uniref:Uncharacterized protein n=1 Tax=Ricinus communis TaxID=3988 RepID=B9STB9_RICCO|nr:conserved hypothetical protein [Ricinus communis]EEF33151.1 conserved hypothetical protein [Ricinus communis]
MNLPLALSPDEHTEGSFSTLLMDAGPRQGPSFDARSMSSMDDSESGEPPPGSFDHSEG